MDQNLHLYVVLINIEYKRTEDPGNRYEANYLQVNRKGTDDQSRKKTFLLPMPNETSNVKSGY